MRKYCQNFTLLIMISILTTPLCFAEITLYRYKDKDGHPVITNTLPPEVADQGYEIISPRGNVIETISPAKNKEELAKEREALEKQKQEAIKAENDRKQAEIQAKKDDILLKSFTNEQDIVRSRDEKLASIDVLVEITNENISRLQKQLNDANTSKTAYEKSNQPVPDSLKKTIEESQRQILENQAFLERKKIEKDEITSKYQSLIDRFQKLHQPEQPASLPK
ncbi:MAG: hypothetical protein HYX61_01505 [Gammaproteobacteria bacterium]|nr:hypothetical protein [Gammaproteobacteria bacterium]